MIVFDAPSSDYIPGKLLTGKFFLTITESTHIESVKFKIQGVSKTSMNKFGNDGFWYHLNEIVVIDSIPKDYTIPGEYPMPFKYLLPYNLPPTFMSQNATVQYEIKILVQTKANDFPNHTTKEFYINRRLCNLKWISHGLALQSSHIFNVPVSSFSKKDCGSLKVNLICKQKILSVEKPAELSFRITNESTMPIEKITVKVLAMVDAVVSFSYPSNETIRSILKRQYIPCEILPGEIKKKQCQITVPYYNIPTFYAKIISVHHFLRVTVHFKGFFNRSVSFQKILTVKFHENEDQEFAPMIRSAPRNNEETVNEVEEIEEESVEPPGYEEIVHSIDDLPSYVEAINAKSSSAI
uniref:Arrestin_N domain-containing protein n=1 Tax=Caenorhabditis tropicalis TaxID=1561998 RepID=A0A1I7UHL5_9PELO